jgi:hypothetical protein
MTEAELEILARSAEEPNIFFDYWFKKPGLSKGWQLDYNFVDDQKWQETMCMAEQSFIVAICGICCADIDSRVYDAELEKYISFRELLETKRAPIVLARGLSGWVKQKATLPFKKGRAASVKVTFSDGNSVTVSKDHRFLTPNRGFVRTRDLMPGDFLVAPCTLPGSSSNGKEYVPHCLERGEDCQDHCSSRSHPRDVQLLHPEGISRSSSPLQDDVQQPNHSPSFFHDTLLEQEQIYKHHLSVHYKDHLQKQPFSHLLRHDVNFSVHYGRLASVVSAQDQHPKQEHLQSVDNSILKGLNGEVSEHIDQVSNLFSSGELDQIQYAIDAFSLDKKGLVELRQDTEQLPLEFRIGQQVLEVVPDPYFSPCGNNSNYYTPFITSIEDVGEIDVYDLHVPNYENYVMEGVVSHNTGKTLGVVMGGAYHSTMTRSFRFLNIASQSWQSGLMHSVLLEQAKDTPFEKLIVSSPTRPYHKIVISFKIGDYIHESSMQFLSTGEKGDATNIMSFRGDWINIEEAGLIENLNEIVGNLATRLTGVSAEGRELLARMSLISNPWDNIELWQLYDMALADKEDGLVFNIDTAGNKNATPRQVKLALKRIPEDQHDKFMTGKRPQGRGDYFSGPDVEACESQALTEIAIAGVKARKPGYIIKDNPILGVWHYQVPRVDGRLYMVIGDPGTGAPPARNAPTIAVFDVTESPKYMPMVAFWWGTGNAKILPFYTQVLYWANFYKAMEVFIDNTGTQKHAAELANIHYVQELREMGLSSVQGLSFASTLKTTYLKALQITIESEVRPLQWPKFLFKSVSAQTKNYDYERDKSTNSKLAQDCVAVLAMFAFAVRAWSRKHHKADSKEDEQHGDPPGRDRRDDSRSRTYGRDPRRAG